MPFIDGQYQRIHNWVADRDNKVPITAKRMDDETDGLVSALNAQNNDLPRKGTLRNVKGSVGSPAYTFTEDDDTGLFSPTEDVVALSAGGHKTIESSVAGTSISNDLLLRAMSIIGQQSDIVLSEKHRIVHSNDGLKIRVGHHFANGTEVFTATGKGAALIELDVSNNELTLKVAGVGAAGQPVSWSKTLAIPAVGDVQLNDGKVWTASNDGAGSGLDADLLGGNAIIPLQRGGTGASSAARARTSLAVYSREETDSRLDAVNKAVILPAHPGFTDTSVDVDAFHGIEHIGNTYINPFLHLYCYSGGPLLGSGTLIVQGSRGQIQKYTYDPNPDIPGTPQPQNGDNKLFELSAIRFLVHNSWSGWGEVRLYHKPYSGV